MTATRRDILLSLGASAGLALPVPTLALPPIPATFFPPPSGPIELSRYVIIYRRRKPVWSDDFSWMEMKTFLSAHRWHFDDQTYTTPLVSCVENGRVFTVLMVSQPVNEDRVGVFELMAPYDTMKAHERDYFFEQIAGAARHAAARAAAILTDQRALYPGAVYIDFPAGDLASPVVTDAPPLIIHTWLSPARDLDAADGEFEEDECEEDELDEDQSK